MSVETKRGRRRVARSLLPSSRRARSTPGSRRDRVKDTGRLERSRRKAREKIFVRCRRCAWAQRTGALPLCRPKVLLELPVRCRQPSGLDVVGELADQHGRFDDLGPLFIEGRSRLHPSHEVRSISGTTDLAQDVNCLRERVLPAFGDDREPVVADIDGFARDPEIKRGLRNEKADYHAVLVGTGYTSSARRWE